MSLFSELKRRNVFKVAAAYVIVGWLIMQVGEVMGPALHLPDWVQSALAFFLILGFPVAIVLSWALEMTPEGIRLEQRAEGDQEDQGGESLAGKKWNAAIIVLLALAVTFFAFDKYVLEPSRDAARVERAVQTAQTDEEPSAQTPQEPAIAVLPFVNMSDDQANEYFSDGISEELLNLLAKVPDLRVISRSSAFSYRGKDIKLDQVAQELNVSHILEGSVRKAGDRVRITAQLIDASNDTHIWSETYDRTLDDIFAVQEDVARSVVASLRATLSPRADQRISRQPTEDLAAYDLYLRGREALHRNEAESNRAATNLFERAIALDPDYALAWAGLADAYAQRDGRFGFPQGSTADRAVEHAQKALALDPYLAEAHRSLGYAYLTQGEIENALEAYLTAVELNPNYYDVWVGLSWIYETTGRYDDGVLAGLRAHRLAPNELSALFYLVHNLKYLSFDEKVLEYTDKMLELDPMYVGARLFKPQLAVYHGNTERALEYAEQLVADLPDHAYALVGAASMAYMAEDYERAIAWAQEAWRLEPGNTLGYWHHNEVLLGLSLAKSGDRQTADSVLLPVIPRYAQRIEAGERDWGLEWDLASIHAVLGKPEKALDWFELAYENGFKFVRWPPVDPAFDGLRDHPRYRNVMAAMKREIDSMRARVLEADPSIR